MFVVGGEPGVASPEVLAQPNHRAAFFNSLLLATLVGVIGTALGFLFAFTAARAGLSPGWVRFLDIATLLPLISPPFTTSISLIYSSGRAASSPTTCRPQGRHHLRPVRHASLAAETLTYFPIAYLTLRPVLSAMGNTLDEMAMSLGSRRLHLFRTVTLPLAVPGLANAFLLLFACSLADFATPLILGRQPLPVLPTEAYLQSPACCSTSRAGRCCPSCCWYRRWVVYISPSATGWGGGDSSRSPASRAPAGSSKKQHSPRPPASSWSRAACWSRSSSSISTRF